MKVVMYLTFLLKLLLKPLVETAASSCPVQQYSGRFKADERKEDKAIIGHSYKNLTIKDPQECFSHCLCDSCICLSYQIFGTRCELLDGPEDLSPASGYHFYPLNEIIKVASGGSCSSGCRNGCCQRNPCMNGGTCVETCKHAKQKFKCICPFGIGGRYCQFIVSCAGIPGNQSSGIHIITRASLTSQVAVYCDFTSESNFIWTLVESFEFSKKSEYAGRKFHENHPVSETSPNWVDYRLSLEDMTHIRTNATHWRATCNFNTANISTTDYVRVDMNTVDIMQAVPSTCYNHIGYLRLLGTSCTTNCKVRFETERYHPFFTCFDCILEGCGNPAYEAFGAYDTVNASHPCSLFPTSTTNYWIGYKINYTSY